MLSGLSAQVNMKRLFYFFLLIDLLSACSAKIGSQINSKQPALADTSFVLVLQKEDNFINDGIAIGSIKSGDNGLSINCTYYEVIDKLRKLARQSGANVIKITELKNPDAFSSCGRLRANIYKVPDFRKHEKEIEWASKRKLIWEDFKGSPKSFTNPNAAAQTYCGFAVQSNYVTMFSTAKIFARNFFTCNLSWVRPDQKNRSDLLEHEQGHFDLCEIYTRMLRKEFTERRMTAYNINKEADVIFKNIYALYLERQELYEEETNYGLNEQKQIEWRTNINRELNSLKDYIQ